MLAQFFETRCIRVCVYNRLVCSTVHSELCRCVLEI